MDRYRIKNNIDSLVDDLISEIEVADNELRCDIRKLESRCDELESRESDLENQIIDLKQQVDELTRELQEVRKNQIVNDYQLQ